MAPAKFDYLFDEPLIGDALEDTENLSWVNPIAEEIHKIAGSKAANGPFSVAVFGPWGSGKTTVMQAFKACLEKSPLDTRTVWFEPWRYEHEEHLLIPLLSEMTVQAHQYEGQSEETQTKIIEYGKKLLGRSGKMLLRAGSGYVGQKLGYTSQEIRDFNETASIWGKHLLGAYQDVKEDGNKSKSRYATETQAFRDDFQALVGAIRGKRVGGVSPPVCVFIDDLDRCSATQVRRLMEAMKNFLWEKGVIYFLALDRDQVTEAMAQPYLDLYTRVPNNHDPLLRAKESATNYLEKFFNFPISITDELSSASIANQSTLKRAKTTFMKYHKEAFETDSSLKSDCREAIGLLQHGDQNLRRLKRTLRWLHFEVIGGDTENLIRRTAEFILAESFPRFWISSLANHNSSVRQRTYYLLSNILGELEEADFNLDNINASESSLQFLIKGLTALKTEQLEPAVNPDNSEGETQNFNAAHDQTLKISYHAMQGTSAGAYVIDLAITGDLTSLDRLYYLIDAAQE